MPISRIILPFSQKSYPVFGTLLYLHNFCSLLAEIMRKCTAQTVALQIFCNLILFSHLYTFFLHNFQVSYRYKEQHRFQAEPSGRYLNSILIFFIFSSPLLMQYAQIETDLRVLLFRAGRAGGLFVRKFG